MDSSNQNGQSTIEFILTFVFGLSLIFFVINSSLNHATGYLVHYATFMASRVYLTADSHTIGSLNGSVEKAKESFEKYNLGIFKINSNNFKVNKVEDVRNRNENLTVGAYTTFELTMDLIGQIAGQKKMELVSESFLGKEPTRAECAERVCYAISSEKNCENMDITLYDDGC